jgi:tRNA (mo5U34)-methyltransferase
MFRRATRQTRDQVEREVRTLGWWYQHFELPSGVWTGDGLPPAYDPSERWQVIAPYLPLDLEGKTVLDVGGNAGYFSLQAKLRGAAKCVLVEPVPKNVKQARFVFSQFRVRVKIVCEDVHTYCLSTKDRFDYVLFLGLFYHLKYPVLVLDRLAEMTKARLFFQSHVTGPQVDPEQLSEEEMGDALAATFPRLAFVEESYRSDFSNWWIPNYQALEPLARSAGLKIVARPHPEILVTEPTRHLGTVSARRLVFPRYGKPGHPTFPPRGSAKRLEK